jgi:hypothetical protein
VKIDADAPALNLAPIQFRNWEKPGIAIRADKAAQHALNLRTVAESVRIGKADKHYADYLCRFADQLSPMATSEALQTDRSELQLPDETQGQVEGNT